MPLVPTAQIVAEARERKVGVAAFNVLHLETVTALVAAAERARLPLVLQISENCVRYHGSLEPIARAAMAAAAASEQRFSLHLDHAEDEDLARRAVDLGFSSIMYDGARLDFENNVAATHRITEYAHRHDVYVEAELGEIGGKQGAHAPGVRTDPDEALEFVTSTGVDSLAVAVGSSHAMTDRTAQLDLELISRLSRNLPLVPLVLHGSSGVADAHIQEAIGAGIVKVNVSTHLNKAFTGAVRTFLEDDPDVVDSRKYLGTGREALSQEAERLLRIISMSSAVTNGRG
ncbi:class II fructose-bisphosphate aldolase [Arthrobacter echini]|uniref:Class II fructose-bisphosphate aldolase n=1 Tax=Arthrobacter echini TaxID=1529066 RepID=A0A4S5E753_9MICC|nr:class II fructose-bisphosphate aldolase [Arthrobacter echini]THJ67303.1 class II fructose-bisphosphate aldolase [Arthrobacter echini]